MPSVVHPRSGPFPIYSSTSPPAIDVGMFVVSKTGVDLKNAATITIFTIPTGRTFIFAGASIFVTAVNTGGAGTFVYQFKESSGARLMSSATTSSSATPVANQTTLQQNLSQNAVVPWSSCAAGNSVQMVLGASNAGSTAVTGTVYVWGFYST